MSIKSLSKRLRGEAPCDPSPHVLVVVGYRGGTLRQSALHLARQAGVPLLTVDDLCPAPHPTPEGEVPTASAVFEVEALLRVAAKFATGRGCEVNSSGEVTECLPTEPNYGGYVPGAGIGYALGCPALTASTVAVVVEVPADGMVDKVPEIVESVTTSTGVPPWAMNMVWVRAGAVSASATLGDTVRDRATLEWREKNLDTYSATAGETFCSSVMDARTEMEAIRTHQPPSPLRSYLVRKSTTWERV